VDARAWQGVWTDTSIPLSRMTTALSLAPAVLTGHVVIVDERRVAGVGVVAYSMQWVGQWKQR
jgi:hypothetical protein